MTRGRVVLHRRVVFAVLEAEPTAYRHQQRPVEGRGGGGPGWWVDGHQRARIVRHLRLVVVVVLLRPPVRVAAVGRALPPDDTLCGVSDRGGEEGEGMRTDGQGEGREKGWGGVGRRNEHVALQRYPDVGWTREPRTKGHGSSIPGATPGP